MELELLRSAAAAPGPQLCAAEASVSSQLRSLEAVAVAARIAQAAGVRGAGAAPKHARQLLQTWMRRLHSLVSPAAAKPSGGVKGGSQAYTGFPASSRTGLRLLGLSLRQLPSPLLDEHVQPIAAQLAQVGQRAQEGLRAGADAALLDLALVLEAFRDLLAQAWGSPALRRQLMAGHHLGKLAGLLVTALDYTYGRLGLRGSPGAVVASKILAYRGVAARLLGGVLLQLVELLGTAVRPQQRLFVKLAVDGLVCPGLAEDPTVSRVCTEVLGVLAVVMSPPQVSAASAAGVANTANADHEAVLAAATTGDLSGPGSRQDVMLVAAIQSLLALIGQTVAPHAVPDAGALYQVLPEAPPLAPPVTSLPQAARLFEDPVGPVVSAQLRLGGYNRLRKALNATPETLALLRRTLGSAADLVWALLRGPEYQLREQARHPRGPNSGGRNIPMGLLMQLIERLLRLQLRDTDTLSSASAGSAGSAPGSSSLSAHSHMADDGEWDEVDGRLAPGLGAANGRGNAHSGHSGSSSASSEESEEDGIRFGPAPYAVCRLLLPELRLLAVRLAGGLAGMLGRRLVPYAGLLGVLLVRQVQNADEAGPGSGAAADDPFAGLGGRRDLLRAEAYLALGRLCEACGLAAAGPVAQRLLTASTSLANTAGVSGQGSSTAPSMGVLLKDIWPVSLPSSSSALSGLGKQPQSRKLGSAGSASSGSVSSTTALGLEDDLSLEDLASWKSRSRTGRKRRLEEAAIAGVNPDSMHAGSGAGSVESATNATTVISVATPGSTGSGTSINALSMVYRSSIERMELAVAALGCLRALLNAGQGGLAGCGLSPGLRLAVDTSLLRLWYGALAAGSAPAAFMAGMASPASGGLQSSVALRAASLMAGGAHGGVTGHAAPDSGASGGCGLGRWLLACMRETALECVIASALGCPEPVGAGGGVRGPVMLPHALGVLRGVAQAPGGGHLYSERCRRLADQGLQTARLVLQPRGVPMMVRGGALGAHGEHSGMNGGSAGVNDHVVPDFFGDHPAGNHAGGSGAASSSSSASQFGGSSAGDLGSDLDWPVGGGAGSASSYTASSGASANGGGELRSVGHFLASQQLLSQGSMNDKPAQAATPAAAEVRMMEMGDDDDYESDEADSHSNLAASDSARNSRNNQNSSVKNNQNNSKSGQTTAPGQNVDDEDEDEADLDLAVSASASAGSELRLKPALQAKNNDGAGEAENAENDENEDEDEFGGEDDAPLWSF